jgi:hypothetical protein
MTCVIRPETDRFRCRTTAFLLVLLGIPATVAATTFYVANTGADTLACGPVPSFPCRSITLAVSHALPGDMVLVGPGFYADDLDDDGIFSEPGEESPSGVVITKPLVVISALGASSTFVRHSGDQEAFDIRVSDVEVGRKNKGFTIRTAHHGFTVAGSDGNPTVSRIVGNVIVFEAPVPATITPLGIESVYSRSRIEHNRTLGRGTACSGYLAFQSSDRIASNTVMGCNSGFGELSSAGGSYVRNTVIGTSEAFLLNGTIAQFSGNVLIGNGSGVRLEGATTATLVGNAFFGQRSNCGVQNNTGTTIQAINNWWGAPTGPGPDPADASCVFNPGSATVTTPFLTMDPTKGQAAIR